MNRLLVGADTVLQEVAGLFDIENPGFVVFGMPDHDGFASFGPIVVAPIPALFSLEWWWVIYHEAAVYIDVHLFNPDALGPSFSFGHFLRESKKLIPDLLTLALPFRFNLDLFSLMHAKRLSSVKARRAESAIASVALRLSTLFLLSKIHKEIYLFETEEGGIRLDDLGSAWSKALEEKELDLVLESPLRNEILAFLATFIRRVDAFSLSYRRQQAPDLEFLVKDSQLFANLAKQCQTIRSFWRAACDAHLASDSRALLGIEYLVKGLLAWYKSRSPLVDDSLATGEVPLGFSNIADFVYLALKRWEHRVILLEEDGADDREVPADIQERLVESLAVWHQGTTCRSK